MVQVPRLQLQLAEFSVRRPKEPREVKRIDESREVGFFLGFVSTTKEWKKNHRIMKKVKKSRLFCSSGFILIEISGFQMVAIVVTPWFFGTMDLSVSTACVLCRSGLEDDLYFGARQWSRRKLTCPRKKGPF